MALGEVVNGQGERYELQVITHLTSSSPKITMTHSNIYPFKRSITIPIHVLNDTVDITPTLRYTIE